MTTPSPIVFVVDDDDSVRETLDLGVPAWTRVAEYETRTKRVVRR